jgi:hypothetical protein
MRALSGVVAGGSDTAISGHFTTVLSDPPIAQFNQGELVRLVDDLICPTFVDDAEVGVV